MPRVTGLFVYPVKSCRGHAVTAAELDAWGLAGDRRFLIVTPEGQFVTQRQEPRLALIEPQLGPDRLTLAADTRGSVSVSLSAVAARHATQRVTIWKDTLLAEDCGDEAAAWLTGVLGQPLRLVKMGADYHRPVKPSKAQPGDVVNFADAYPLLLLSEASVDHLNDRIQAAGGERVPINRFRPNVVVTGCEPFAEDRWKRFRLGEVPLRNAGPCARCIIPTIDQRTAERGKEPLRTLAAFRRDPENPSDVHFGINVIHEAKTGKLHVGSEVTLAD